MFGKKEFKRFLQEWQDEYGRKARGIALFDSKETSTWTKKQKQLFIRLFYHARGHFGEFLWLLATRCEEDARRHIVVENIRDELGTLRINDRSHESLFREFGEAHGVDMQDAELERAYLPFLREFNKGHVEWIRSHTEEENWAMFSAYELLDNVDYRNLLELAKGIGTHEELLEFFEVHTGSGHFKETQEELFEVWSRNPVHLKEAFAFIAEHQLTMWQALSDEVFKA